MNRNKELLDQDSKQNRIFPIFSRLLLILLWVYSSWLLLWNVLRIWPGESWWAVALVNYFAFWFFITLLPIILITFILHRRYLFLVSLLAGLLLSIRFIPIFFNSSTGPEDTQSIKVMTFNVYKYNQDLEGILAVIKEEDPDILALQELTPFISEGLHRELGIIYPFHTLDSALPIEGQGLLSKFGLWEISDLPDYRFLSAIAQSPIGNLQIVNVHAPKITPYRWSEGWEEQRDFVHDLLDQTRPIQTPVLLLGDFNTTSLSENYKLIREEYQDAFASSGSGLGFTYPAREKLGIKLPMPLIRIDYIFHSEELESFRTEVLKESSDSDHRPVVSILSLQDRNR